MIKAYHATGSGEALDAILERGEIVPAVYRLDLAWVRKDCKHDINRFEKHHGSGKAPAAKAATTELVEDFLKDFEGVIGSSKGRPTMLRCGDVVAGDANRIFLSAFTWTHAKGPHGRRPGHTGLAYDALDLIQKGAVVRQSDFYAKFYGAIREVFERSAELTSERAKEDLEYGLFGVLENEPLKGGRAIQFLMDHEHVEHHPEIEVVWEGPLPVEWAIEIWKRNKLLAPAGA